MRRVLAVIGHIILNWIANTLDLAAIYSQSGECGKKALGNAVSRIHPFSIAPFSDDVAVSDDDAVCFPALLRQGSKHATKGFDLGGEIRRDRTGLRLCVGDSLIKQ